ncbi:hypothetical protein GGE24_007646 [Bradyrhizobium centrosematis]|nr:hypothetical protein [Bradyrhizobium centrosematis]MCS3778269.1 hypothetical protein [Bradyrhizobium centrosematis]
MVSLLWEVEHLIETSPLTSLFFPENSMDKHFHRSDGE